MIKKIPFLLLAILIGYGCATVPVTGRKQVSLALRASHQLAALLPFNLCACPEISVGNAFKEFR